MGCGGYAWGWISLGLLIRGYRQDGLLLTGGSLVSIKRPLRGPRRVGGGAIVGENYGIRLFVKFRVFLW